LGFEIRGSGVDGGDVDEIVCWIDEFGAGKSTGFEIREDFGDGSCVDCASP